MKRHLIYLLASAALLAGCSSETKTDETGFGTLDIRCSADASIDVASDQLRTHRAATEPTGETFSLTITGESGTQSWETVAAYSQSGTVFKMGSYTAAIAHGDSEAEGIDKPYYTGSTTVTVIPRRTVTAEIIAKIGNSQVLVRATEQFLAYFHDAKFTVTTGSGNEFVFTPGSEPADEPVFVKAATPVTITGTARRQSPTGTGEGPEVTFGEQTLGAAKAQTRHIFTFDAQDAGSATLTITLGEELTETHQIPVELNDGAIDDTNE